MLWIPKLVANGQPHYVQLYEAMKSEIVSGRIAEQTRLPSVRKLADQLGVSTTPVEMAYSQLLAEGFIESKPRSGYYVQKVPEPYITIGNGKPQGWDSTSLALRPQTEYRYDFHLSKNDFTHFPFQTWRRLYNQTLREDQKEILFYGDPQGEYGLRSQIANYLQQFRGVVCSPEQIVIGAEQYLLLSLLSLILKQQCTKIGVENPGYPLLSSTFRQHGFDIVPISLTDDGIDLDQLYQSSVQLVTVSPSHQFPRGMVMPISKRYQLLEWSKTVDGFIIEDDYDGEFRYHGRPIPSLQGLLPETNVIYLGGFAQVLAPAICINYMVLPQRLLAPYRQLYNQILFEQSTSRLHQRTLQLFMEKGFWEKHVRRMRNIYRKKHDTLIMALQKYFGGKATIVGKDAGFHVLLQVDSVKTEAELIHAAKSAGIQIASTSFTWLQPSQHPQKEFFVGFGGIPLEQIDEGIKRLSEVWLNTFH